MVSTSKLLEIYLKMLKEKIVISDKTQKMVDDNLHGSYFGIKRIWASEPIGIKGEPSIKKMLFPASLEDALELLQQRIQFSKAVNCGARVIIEGSPTQSVSFTYFFLFEPSISPPPTPTSLGL